MRPIVLRAKEKNVFKSNKNHDDVALQPSLDTDQKPHLQQHKKKNWSSVCRHGPCSPLDNGLAFSDDIFQRRWQGVYLCS